MRTNLIVVRAGANSLHQEWLRAPYSERNFDLVVSYFDKTAFQFYLPIEGVKAVFHIGGKWDGLYATFQDIDVKEYENFWLPDDDIAMSVQAVNKMFSLHQANELSVSQPSLTRDSFYSHFVFMTCLGLDLRFANFIEIMAPCLSRTVLEIVLPYFASTKSGYGLDYLWCRLHKANRHKAAILDGVQMHHTRPVGGELKKHLSSLGEKPESEEQKLKKSINLKGRTVPVVYAGVRMDNLKIEGRHKMAYVMLRGWLKEFDGFSDKRAALLGIGKTIRRQFFNKLELSQIHIKTVP